MNADERTKELIEKWLDSPCSHGVPQMTAILQSLIVKALKEQDRDTRHACAEAVVTLPRGNKYTDSDGNQWVGLHAAHAACMNVKAV